MTIPITRTLRVLGVTAAAAALTGSLAAPAEAAPAKVVKGLPKYCKLTSAGPVKKGGTIQVTTVVKCTRKVDVMGASAGVSLKAKKVLKRADKSGVGLKSISTTAVYKCPARKSWRTFDGYNGAGITVKSGSRKTEYRYLKGIPLKRWLKAYC